MGHTYAAYAYTIKDIDCDDLNTHTETRSKKNIGPNVMSLLCSYVVAFCNRRVFKKLTKACWPKFLVPLSR